MSCQESPHLTKHHSQYRLLPYLYTLFHHHAVSGGTVSCDWWTRGHVTTILTSDWPQVVRPLWHEFPRDAATLDIDDAFMWGRGLVIAPVISPATDTRTLYLPPGAR